ncbi:hypothetical protein KKG83_06495 [Candidatus Micrarchaeota archaeon]|nr:hypothetical protein [Candidatus Micrarchaeota archaeon]
MEFKKFFSKRRNLIAIIAVVVVLFFVVSYLWNLSQIPQWNEKVPSDLKIEYEQSIFGRQSFIEVGSGGLLRSGLKESEKNKVYIQKEGYLEEEEIKEIISEFYEKNFFTLSKEYHDSFLNFINQESSRLEILSIRFNGKTYTVKDYGNSGPKNLKELIRHVSDKASEQPQKIYSCTDVSDCDIICYREAGVIECIDNKCECFQPDIPVP